MEFGPCKHGQFKKTTYQEIFVYDLIAHDDALRHSVCVSDQVIAPFEPEGERYGPGVVIQGQEKRAAQGTLEDLFSKHTCRSTYKKLHFIVSLYIYTKIFSAIIF